MGYLNAPIRLNLDLLVEGRASEAAVGVRLWRDWPG